MESTQPTPSPEMREAGPALSKLSFSQLPFEIRMMIWKFAIPKPRVIRLDFKTSLDRPCRAFDMGPPFIPKLLHICHESREVACEVYRLGFGTSTSIYDKDWWNPSADMVYFAAWNPPAAWDLKVERETDTATRFETPYDMSLRNEPSRKMILRYLDVAAIQHLALSLSPSVYAAFDILDSQNWPAPQGASWGLKWLSHFTSLKSVSFLIDHFPTWYRPGEILLYEPLEESLFEDYGPNQIMAGLEQRIRDFSAEFAPDWEVPDVELLVMGHRKRRDPGPFCLTIGPPESDDPPGGVPGALPIRSS
ncbi:hypothetical protein G7Y89_g31 [Cudoniella acicularis]|uniref:2EXR domain-containing protein n=1 Tax=Cudoniella acicularis TaxID=354080 RepID=A0A8H4WBK7_9HELO|nr:hypothetical protein G7Y89_g31 [Cudoniella acicularis]